MTNRKPKKRRGKAPLLTHMLIPAQNLARRLELSAAFAAGVLRPTLYTTALLTRARSWGLAGKA